MKQITHLLFLTTLCLTTNLVGMNSKSESGGNSWVTVFNSSDYQVMANNFIPKDKRQVNGTPVLRFLEKLEDFMKDETDGKKELRFIHESFKKTFLIDSPKAFKQLLKCLAEEEELREIIEKKQGFSWQRDGHRGLCTVIFALFGLFLVQGLAEDPGFFFSAVCTGGSGLAGLVTSLCCEDHEDNTLKKIEKLYTGNRFLQEIKANNSPENRKRR